MTARDLDAVAAEMERRVPGGVERDAPSAALTTYRCGGPLAVLVRIRAERDLSAVVEVLAAYRPATLVVGRGSNLLVADRGFPGVALVLEGDFEEVSVDAGAGRARAGGAAALPVLARRAAAAGVGGLEFYVGIPGSVGGAVRMNAGGHGRETRDVLARARVVDLVSGAVRERFPDDLAFGYRRSALGADDVVLDAEFEGTPEDPALCEQRIAEAVRWRRDHQPGGANAGSVFANPPGDSAGRLIDGCGLKGLRVGGAIVSDKHANFVLAGAGATAADVRGVMDEVRRRVAAATGVVLEPELRMVGFDPVPAGPGAPGADR